MKERARERDGYACTRCGMTDTQHRVEYNQTLQVHRVIPGSDYTVDGCITVCQACHGKLPKRRVAGIKKVSRPGMTPVFFEMTDEMAKELDLLVASLPLGTKADHIRLALDRHLDNPPTVTVPELPPLEVRAPVPTKGKRARKGK